MKRICTVFLAAVLALGALTCLPLSAAAEGGSGRKAISTPQELYAVRNDLKGNYYLTADIVFTEADFAPGGAFYNGGKGWEPIGTELSPFLGSFDGNGHCIKNLYINVSYDAPEEGAFEDIYIGLFGYTLGSVSNTGMVNDRITVEIAPSTYINSYIYAYAGGIAGRNEGTITNCYHTGSVSVVSTSVEAFEYSHAHFGAGGIVGYNGKNTYRNTYGTVSNCYNTGEITTSGTGEEGFAGGIAGLNENTVTECHNAGSILSSVAPSNAHRASSLGAGGIVGQSYGTVARCGNAGSITAQGKDSANAEAGGIVAESASAWDATPETVERITECYNTGSVTAVCVSSDDYASADAGGIIGFNYGNTVVEQCYNTGKVSASATATEYCFVFSGGIAGWNYGVGVIKACYNVGSVEASASPDEIGAEAGGIAGENYSEATITGCYYLDTIGTGVGTNSGTYSAVKCTAESMKKQSTFAGFDFDTVWTMGTAAEFPYPVLRRAAVAGQRLTLGDLGGDGSIDATDYMLLKRAVLGTFKLTAEQEIAADVNRDGKVDAVDYMLVKRHVLGTYKIA